MIQVARLEGFYWVAVTGGYSRAAEAFPYPITQPGVHQQVRRLEDDIGARLLERAGRDRMVLTDAGRELFDHVRPFFEGLPEVVERVRSGKHVSRVRIAASIQIIEQILPAWLARARRKRADVQIEVSELEDDPLAPLRSFDADLVVEHVVAWPRDLEAKRVGTIGGFAIVPAELATRTMSKRLLRSLPFLAYPNDTPERRIQVEGLAHYDLTPRVVGVGSTAKTLTAMVAAGLGFSLIPSADPRGVRDDRVRAYRVNTPTAVWPVFALWRRRPNLSAGLQSVLDAAPAVAE